MLEIEDILRRTEKVVTVYCPNCCKYVNEINVFIVLPTLSSPSRRLSINTAIISRHGADPNILIGGRLNIG